MIEKIKAFFEQFSKDVPLFDGNIIAAKYRQPYLVASASGDLWLCSSRSDTVDYFQTLLDKHKSQGVESCEYSDFEMASIGDNNFMATVTWTTKNKAGETITTWRESYNLSNRPDEGLKIFASIDH